MFDHDPASLIFLEGPHRRFSMRRTTWRNGGRSAIFPALALGLLVNAVACGDENPVTPTPTPQPLVTEQSINLSGVTALQRPGDTSQLTAIVTFSDGTTRDVSSTAGWGMDRPGVASVGRSGLLVAQAYGQCNVTVRYGSVSARAPVRVAPEGTFLLSGHVFEETGLPLWQARVSIPSSTGDLKTSTSWNGAYTLPVRGEVDVRAEMDNFEAQVKRVTVLQDEALDFHLKFKTNGFVGMYRLVFIASPTCTLPADVMRRTYMARVEERASGLVVILSGVEFVAWGEAGFTGRRDGLRVQFDITSDFGPEYTFVELLDASRELAFDGIATGEIGETFVTVFSGSVTVRNRIGNVTVARCEAGDHRLEFSR
jgi:hypothetical protein